MISGIIPISKEDALEYVERYADIETIEKYFKIVEA